jgi:nucleoside-diphosphate-sugar epimerase
MTGRELVLVTGAAGLVGSRLAQRFLREGLSVRALDLRPFELPGVECLLGNVTDPDEMQRAAAGAAVVAHCAAIIAGDDEEMTRVNAEGTRLLVESALDAGCRRFLHVSTGAVYAFKDRPVVDESTPFLREGGVFHLSKVQAEEVVWAASARGLPVTVFRPLVILGAHPSSTWSALLAQRIIKGEPVMRGDGSGSLPYVHVANLVDAMITAMHTAHAVGQAYNIVDGQVTGREYLDRVCRWLGVDALVPRGEVVPWRGRYSGAKAERELGYAPRVSYEEAMAETERYLAEIGMIKA